MVYIVASNSTKDILSDLKINGVVSQYSGDDGNTFAMIDLGEFSVLKLKKDRTRYELKSK